MFAAAVVVAVAEDAGVREARPRDKKRAVLVGCLREEEEWWPKRKEG